MEVIYVTCKQYLDEIRNIYDRGFVVIKAEKVGDLVAITFGTRKNFVEARERSMASL